MMTTDEIGTQRFVRFELRVKSRDDNETKLLPEVYSTLDRAWTQAVRLVNTGEYLDVKIVEVITVRTTHAVYT